MKLPYNSNCIATVSGCIDGSGCTFVDDCLNDAGTKKVGSGDTVFGLNSMSAMRLRANRTDIFAC
jgi:hypothetical protein